MQMLAYARAEVSAPAIALARKSYELNLSSSNSSSSSSSSDPALLPPIAVDAACDRDQAANAAFLAQHAEHRTRGTHLSLSEEKVGVARSYHFSF
jgi:hypothetical protein